MKIYDRSAKGRRNIRRLGKRIENALLKEIVFSNNYEDGIEFIRKTVQETTYAWLTRPFPNSPHKPQP